MNSNRNHLHGLAGPLAAITIAAVAFTALADSVIEGDDLVSIDPTVTSDLVDHRTSALTTAAHLLSFIGSEVILAVLSICLIIVLLERRGPGPACIAAGAMATSAGATVGVKAVFGRARPDASDRLGAFDSTYSFPSGHTLNSAVFLGLVCLLLVPLLSQRRTRIGAYGAAAVLAIGIGTSRIYLGYHWTTDVLASWSIAAVLLTVVHVINWKLATPAQRSGSVQVAHNTLDS